MLHFYFLSEHTTVYTDKRERERVREKSSVELSLCGLHFERFSNFLKSFPNLFNFHSLLSCAHSPLVDWQHLSMLSFSVLCGVTLHSVCRNFPFSFLPLLSCPVTSLPLSCPCFLSWNSNFCCPSFPFTPYKGKGVVTHPRGGDPLTAPFGTGCLRPDVCVHLHGFGCRLFSLWERATES